MPQANNLTIPAASVTDLTVDEVMDIVDRKEGVTTFRYTGDGSIGSSNLFQVTVKQPTSNSQYYRVRLHFSQPLTTVNDVTGEVVNSFVNRGSVEFQINKASTTADALACTERVLALMADADVQSVITKCENFF